MRTTLTVKGMTNMNYSKETKRFARTLVVAYSQYNKPERRCYFDSDKIPDYDVHKLVSFMMKDDPAMANEANGLDNPAYETLMYPALLKSISDSSLESSLNFSAAWKKGVAIYFKSAMDELLDSILDDYNFEIKTINAA
jgi:hypothetical protein